MIMMPEIAPDGDSESRSDSDGLPVEPGDDTEWCDKAISDAQVATVPGTAFGTPGYARISYANSKERLQEAVDRLAANDLI